MADSHSLGYSSGLSGLGLRSVLDASEKSRAMKRQNSLQVVYGISLNFIFLFLAIVLT